MGYMKQYYHEKLNGELDEPSQLDYEEMSQSNIIVEAAEICANDTKAFELLIRKMHSLESG